MRLFAMTLLLAGLYGRMLVIMIATCIVLAMNYTPSVGGAFNSVEHIMRDVSYG
jgi:quinol-cytochrome oxidoreductase complex cytochrome b subunit